MPGIKSKLESFFGIEIKVLIAVIAIIVGTVGFIIIAGLVSRGSSDQFDLQILRSFRVPGKIARPIGPVWMFEVMRDVTSLGGPTVVFLIIIFVIGYFILQKQYSMLFLVLVAVIGGAVMDLELKEFFGRIRPQIIPTLMQEKSFAFPSGHSMMSAIVYLSLASLIARLQVRWRDKIYIIIVAVFLSFIIGISRIYLGVHYPTDVLGGWSLGLAWAALCWFAAWYISQKRSGGIISKSGNDLPGNGR
ncbi:MAG: phosphatase PAP2 family protein [Ignavibacteriaceae bacterium]|nr:phosphatase PAP2 family protein [Ignavibacteriaceae bacterium]